MNHSRRAAGAFAMILATGVAAPALASSLHLRLESGGSTSITVAPGATVTWTAVGTLSDDANEGLALFSVDLLWSGGTLPPAATPTTNPMLNFARPAGVNNPAGFGGTPSAGMLRQVGGAQNTINSAFAPYPIGSVVTGVAWPSQPAALATGQLTAPLAPGILQLDRVEPGGQRDPAGRDGRPVLARGEDHAREHDLSHRSSSRGRAERARPALTTVADCEAR